MKKILRDTKPYIIVLLSVMVVIVWGLVLGSRPMSGDTSPVRVLIAKGASANEVALILKEKDLIRSTSIFVFTCRMSGESGKLKPGVYELSRAMSVPEIIRALVKGESLELWVTMPEGLTARQIGDRLAERQLVNGDLFVQKAIDEGFGFQRYAFVPGDNLEGYLFPDTYLVARGTGADAVIEKMLEAFDAKVVTPNRDQLERVIRSRFGLGREDFRDGLSRILTLASLVEREARVPADRPLVAAVMWNRLKKNMRLEVDATVTYVPGESRENKSKVYYSDLRSDSPYNTYRVFGLPPAPICNPGLAAIKAVLEPSQESYLFYVARPDGGHVFTRTLEEHIKARNAIRNGKN